MSHCGGKGKCISYLYTNHMKVSQVCEIQFSTPNRIIVFEKAGYFNNCCDLVLGRESPDIVPKAQGIMRKWLNLTLDSKVKDLWWG